MLLLQCRFRYFTSPLSQEVFSQPLSAPADLKVSALRTAGELRRKDLLPAICEQNKSADEQLRFWSAWGAIILGDRNVALEMLKAMTISDSSFRCKAPDLVLHCLTLEEGQRWLKGLAQYPQWRYELVVGADVLGDPAYVPCLIGQMNKPELSRAAGEAICMIAGVDIAYEDLDGNRPEDFHSGPTEDSRDNNVAMDDEENLQWPDPVKLQKWWNNQGHRWTPGIRHLVGASISEAHCGKILVEGYQRQRITAALELALLEPSKPLFETRVIGARQLPS